MDYLDQVTIVRHADFAGFDAWRRQERLTLVLMTTAAERHYLGHGFADDQIILFGRESAGVPQAVHDAADVRLLIPVREGLRSLNIAVSMAMVAGEALRQTAGFPR
jgi:tRNA (cytidine/uridine-2'-O-)-methyltransferase